MNHVINSFIAALNDLGRGFCDYAGRMFIQTGILILLLLLVDFLVRKRVRATFRYWMWMLVFIKLVLPPTLALPTGVGYWFGGYFPAGPIAADHPSDVTQLDPAPETTPSAIAQAPYEPIAPVVSDPPTMTATTDSSVAPGLNALTWQGILFGLWIIGVLAITALLAQRIFFVRGLIRQSEPAKNGFAELLNHCRQRLGLRRRIELRLSHNVTSPAVCGLFRPAILIPEGIVERLSQEKLRTVLIHELAHIKRGDLWINCVQTLVQIAYFYNPFVWLANALVCRIREQAVDETVLVALGAEAKSYSSILIDIAEMASFRANLALSLIGVAESKKSLERRIKHMLNRAIPKSAKVGVFGTIAILVVAAALLPMARAQKSSKNTPAAEASTAAGVNETSARTGASDIVVDPNTGLKFTVAARISAENDVIIHNNTVHLSPNGKFLLWRGWVTPLDGGKPWRLTEDMDSDRNYAAWSPDGKLIAYRAESGRIWLLPVSPETGQATGPARKLVDDPANWYNGMILWSADSEWVLLYYYERGNRPTEKCISVRDGRLMEPLDHTRFSLPSGDQKRIAYFRPGNSVWTAPAGGGVARLAVGTNRWGSVTRVPPPGVEGWAMGPIPLWWSPDSEWLLCGESWRGYQFLNLTFVRLADRREVALKFPEQSGDIGPEAVGLVVSPDSKKLRFFKNAHYLRLAAKLAPIGGGGFAETPFARQFDVLDIQEARGPQGQGLVFTGFKGHWYDRDKLALYIAPAGGGEPVEVKLNVSLTGDPQSWLVSPDGKRLFSATYTTRGQERLGNFHVIPISLDRAQSTGPATLILKDFRPPKGRWTLEDVAWSPDSSRLVLCAKGQADGDLYVVPADGGPARQLTQSPDEVEQSPMWSPDGKLIAYCVNAASGVGVNLHVVPAEGGAPRRLWTWTTPTGRGQLRHAWFPDSREIGVESDDGIVAVAVADGTARPFLKLADIHFTWLWWLQWSPDGQTLALFGGGDDAYCAAAFFRPSDRKVELLPSDAWIIDLGWTADSQALFCVAEQPDRIRPDALVYEVDLMEAWTQAKNSVAGASSPAGTSTTAKREVPPLVNGEFGDDFEDGDTKYWAFQDNANEGTDHVREVRNGELVVENTSAILGSAEWTNYVVTVRMCLKRVPMTRDSIAGIAFRSGAYGDYMVGAQQVAKDVWQLWSGIGYSDAEKRLRAGTLAAPPYNFVLDKWYTLEAQVQGPRIVVRVDGRALIDVNDESCPRGAVKLHSAGGTRVHFDDLSVRLLP